MKPLLIIFVLLFITFGSSHAALHDRGGGLIYDDVLDITWLQNTNQGAGSVYDNGWNILDGLMTWDNAKAWADNLAFGGYDDWRLPTALNQDGSGPCFEYNCSDSELGHMFYNNLGGIIGQSVLMATDMNNYLEHNGGFLTNVQSDGYWSDTEWAYEDIGAWIFGTDEGWQGIHHKDNELFAWAVRNGDSSVVPIPATAWLFGSGLLGLVGFTKRKKAA